LGSLSLILSNKEISEVGDSLANNIIQHANRKEILYYTVGFNSIVKNVGNKLGPDVVTKILPFILKDIHNRIGTDSEDFEFVNELIDYYLSIIDNLVKKCPGETKPYLRDIIDAVYHLISYDPNSAVDDEGDMEIEEGGNIYSLLSSVLIFSKKMKKLTMNGICTTPMIPVGKLEELPFKSQTLLSWSILKS